MSGQGDLFQIKVDGDASYTTFEENPSLPEDKPLRFTKSYRLADGTLVDYDTTLGKEKRKFVMQFDHITEDFAFGTDSYGESDGSRCLKNLFDLNKGLNGVVGIVLKFKPFLNKYGVATVFTVNIVNTDFPIVVADGERPAIGYSGTLILEEV